MTKIITVVALHLIQWGLHQALSASDAPAAGATTPETVGLRIATLPRLATGATTAGSGSYSP